MKFTELGCEVQSELFRVVYLLRLNFMIINYVILRIHLSCWSLVVGF